MDYKLLCTKCEQIALKCHSYVDKSILVEKNSSAQEEVKEKVPAASYASYMIQFY